MDLLKFCPKCGNIEFYFNENKCPFCGFDMVETKYTFGDYLNDSSNIEKQIKEYVRKSSEFDEELFKKRKAKENKEIYNSSSAIEQKVLQDIGAIPKPIQCPYCKSTDTKKITNTSKAIHTAFFGIFSISRNSKQWHCNNCKSDF